MDNKVAVTHDPLDLIKFLKRDGGRMNLMCEQAEMFEGRIYDRTKAIFDYFDLSFAAARPAL